MKSLLALTSFLLLCASAQAATYQLLPQVGISLLAVSCGGVHTSTYVTGFAPDGNVTGEVYAWTRCGSSGRGGGYKSRLYQSWHSLTWDLMGQAVETHAWDGVTPDAAFTATDEMGDAIGTTTTATGATIGVLVTP